MSDHPTRSQDESHSHQEKKLKRSHAGEPLHNSLSILPRTTVPMDDLALQLCQFLKLSLKRALELQETSYPQSHLEIEAKLGQILYKKPNPNSKRIQIPLIQSECLIQWNSSDWNFTSSMSLNQHAHLNKFLNTQVHPQSPVKYLHTYMQDIIYPNGTRVSRDTKSGKVVGIMSKKRISDIEIYCPLSRFDYRISVNLEIPCPEPQKDLIPQMIRKKDRLSYISHPFCIDLTQVKQVNPKTGEETQDPPVHELEIEIKHPSSLIQSVATSSSGAGAGSGAYVQGTNKVLENTVQSLLNTLRTLNRLPGAPRE